ARRPSGPDSVRLVLLRTGADEQDVAALELDVLPGQDRIERLYFDHGPLLMRVLDTVGLAIALHVGEDAASDEPSSLRPGADAQLRAFAGMDLLPRDPVVETEAWVGDVPEPVPLRRGLRVEVVEDLVELTGPDPCLACRVLVAIPTADAGVLAPRRLVE